jgi:hypothetical protein
MKSALEGWGRTPIPASGFRGLVRETALLNLGILLSALAIGAYLGSPANFLILLFLVPMVSILLWSASFAISGFVSLSPIFWGQGLWERRPRYQEGGGDVGDDWLDGPA